MANPTTGSNVTRAIAQTSQYVQELWSREIQQPFDKTLQAAKLVQDRSALAAGGGDVINLPFVAGVNARAKAASTAVTYDSPEGAPVTLNIDKHYYVAVLIEDIAKIQSNYDLRAAFQVRMAEALSRQIDTDLMALYASAGSTVAGGATVDDADMLAVVTAFDTGNTPSSERYGIIGHNTKADLLGVNKYTAYDQTGKTGKAVDGTTDFTGEIYGMQLYHSGNVAVASSNGHNLFFHKTAITLIQQKAPTFEMEYSVDYIGTKTVLYVVYGVGVERAGSLIDLTRTTAA
jgi:hypothetical protein